MEIVQSPWFGPAALLLAGFLLSLLLYITSGATLKTMNPNLGTRTFMVILRLCIGWHLLVAGYVKLYPPVEKAAKGEWSGEGYLRASSGPLAWKFREIAGTPAIDALTINEKAIPILAQQSAGLVASSAQMAPGVVEPPVVSLYSSAVSYPLPTALEKDWQRYFDAFVKYYDLTEDQLKLAKLKFDQAKANTFFWLTTHQAKVELPMPAYPKEQSFTIPEWIAYYRDTEKKLTELESEIPVYGGEIFKKPVQSDLAKQRTQLFKTYGQMKAAVTEQTKKMKESLKSVLSHEQYTGKLPMADPKPSVFEMSTLQRSDLVVMWGLFIAGIGLVLGFCTRPAALFGAILLFMFYLAQPPLPEWPASPQADDQDLYVNSTLILSLALLTIATTPSGRWLGLDGLLQFVWPARRQEVPKSSPHAPRPI